jgi:hypothetical protein
MTDQELERVAREKALAALGRHNARFTLYRSQNGEFRQEDVDFWTNEFLSALRPKMETPEIKSEETGNAPAENRGAS